MKTKLIGMHTGIGTRTAIDSNRLIQNSGKLLLQDAFNLNSLSGIVRFVKRVLLGTFLVEAAGALMYMTVFVPEFGVKGIWISVFTSVSAFCNAGIDIIGENKIIIKK